MYLQNLHTAAQIRLIHNDLPVKAPRTQQRLIQNLRPVRGSQDQNSPGAVKSVHLGQQLIERLFPFFIASAVFGITAPSDCIDLINENDAGRILGRLFKQIAHAGSAHAYI